MYQQYCTKDPELRHADILLKDTASNSVKVAVKCLQAQEVACLAFFL
jgi:hypothetical protein